MKQYIEDKKQGIEIAAEGLQKAVKENDWRKAAMYSRKAFKKVTELNAARHIGRIVHEAKKPTYKEEGKQ